MEFGLHAVDQGQFRYILIHRAFGNTSVYVRLMIIYLRVAGTFRSFYLLDKSFFKQVFPLFGERISTIVGSEYVGSALPVCCHQGYWEIFFCLCACWKASGTDGEEKCSSTSTSPITLSKVLGSPHFPQLGFSKMSEQLQHFSPSSRPSQMTYRHVKHLPHTLSSLANDLEPQLGHCYKSLDPSTGRSNSRLAHIIGQNKVLTLWQAVGILGGG